jgi:histidinol-phosphate aminotransferase
MNPFWSQIARELSPYVPGEQPRIAHLVKLNTNESPFGPSPLALEAMRSAAADTLRLYPDPASPRRARRLRCVTKPTSARAAPRSSRGGKR